MAARDDHHHNHVKRIPLFPLLSLLCFASIFLVLSLSRKTSSNPLLSHQSFQFGQNPVTDPHVALSRSCDYSDGVWIYDHEPRPARYDGSCKEIFKGWNCISNNKSNGWELTKWRWKPRRCDLPLFDPVYFLEKYRNTNIGTLSLQLRWSANANGGMLESLGFKEGFRVDVDVPEGTWAGAPAFHDILIFNTGHWWWAPSKFDPVKSPMLFFKKGLPVIPPIPPDVGLDMVLKHMVLFIEKNLRPGAIKFFRTQSPRHFEGGDWNQGGTCQRLQPLSPEQVEGLFSLKNNGTNVEARLVNRHLKKALKRSGFHILDITHMSEVRADAHPSTSGGKKHDDCMHWCLPGITDTWNDLFMKHLNNIKFRD